MRRKLRAKPGPQCQHLGFVKKDVWIAKLVIGSFIPLIAFLHSFKRMLHRRLKREPAWRTSSHTALSDCTWSFSPQSLVLTLFILSTKCSLA